MYLYWGVMELIIKLWVSTAALRPHVDANCEYFWTSLLRNIEVSVPRKPFVTKKCLNCLTTFFFVSSCTENRYRKEEVFLFMIFFYYVIYFTDMKSTIFLNITRLWFCQFVKGEIWPSEVHGPNKNTSMNKNKLLKLELNFFTKKMRGNCFIPFSWQWSVQYEELWGLIDLIHHF